MKFYEQCDYSVQSRNFPRSAPVVIVSRRITFRKCLLRVHHPHLVTRPDIVQEEFSALRERLAEFTVNRNHARSRIHRFRPFSDEGRPPVGRRDPCARVVITGGGRESSPSGNTFRPVADHRRRVVDRSPLGPVPTHVVGDTSVVRLFARSICRRCAPAPGRRGVCFPRRFGDRIGE